MSNETILLMDDNPSNLKLVKVLLQSYHYDFRTALNAKEAFSVLDSFHPKSGTTCIAGSLI
jgi:CheY-like chemotaxis protein